MLADVRNVIRPPLELSIEVLVVEKVTTVEEVLANVADGPLHFALGLRAIRATGSWSKLPVMSEANELGILNERTTLPTTVFHDDRTHLVEEHLLRNATQESEGLL